MIYFSLGAKSQNLLSRSEDDIKIYFSKLGVDYKEKMYDKNGSPIMHFSYSTISARIDGLIASYYLLDENNICTSVFMLYDDTKFLEGVVNQFKNDTSIERIPNSFSWAKKDGSYRVKITPNDNGTFVVAYSK